MSLRRAIFLQGDLVFGAFDGDTSILLHVPDETFSVLDAHGKLTHSHQVLKFAVKSVRAKLRLLLRFRNFCARNVYVCPHLLEGAPIELDVPVEYLRWPAAASVRQVPTTSDSATNGNARDTRSSHEKQDGENGDRERCRSVGPCVVTSLDKLAEVYRPAHGRLVRVTYPALINKKAVVDEFSSTPRSCYKYHYAKVAQLFLVNDDIPECWHHPISLTCYSRRQSNLPAHSISPRLPTAQQTTNTQSPAARAQTSLLSQRQRYERVFRAFHCAPEKVDSLCGERQPVRAVWTPEATFLVPKDCHGVEALIHGDDSLLSLRANGLIFDHFADPNSAAASRVFPVNSVPLKLTPRNNESTVQTDYLRSVSAVACEIFHHNLSKLRENTATSSLLESNSSCSFPTPAQFSSTVHMTHTVAEIGVFTAFEDGRVRVRFLDRTLLEVLPSHSPQSNSTCKVILPDGESCEVSTDRPLGLARHIQYATRFRDWAFTPQSQRAQHAQVIQAKCAAMQLELRKTERFLHIQRLDARSNVVPMNSAVLHKFKQ